MENQWIYGHVVRLCQNVLHLNNIVPCERAIHDNLLLGGCAVLLLIRWRDEGTPEDKHLV